MTVFKGMARLLTERGINISGLKRQCPDFKCADPDADCCIRRILWNQPDFVNFKSCLEERCEARGFHVLFLPMFHCELNFIEEWPSGSIASTHSRPQFMISRRTYSPRLIQLIWPP
jgi:hypothetical protein